MLHRCPCSTRTLELFIRDFAGLHIRTQQRTQRQIYTSQRRTFATSRAWRRPEVAQVGAEAKREEFVPFDGEVGQGRDVVEERAGEGEREDGTADVGNEWRADTEWHAEIEVLVPKNGEAVVARGREDEGVATSTGSSQAIDAPSKSAVQQPDATTTATMQADDVPTEDTRIKAERRLQRKHQRMASGKFKPQAAARERGEVVEVEEDRHSSVLDKIEKMEGPRVARARPRTAKAASSKADRPVWRATDYKTAKAANPPPPPPTQSKREPWQLQKSALSSKFGDQAWSPRKRLSPDTLDGLRALHASDPVTYSTATLSAQFAISPENIRRILRSKWRPNEEEKVERAERWERRGVRKWSAMAEGGEKPPRRWREMGAGSLRGAGREGRPSWKKGGSRGSEWVERDDGEGEGLGLGGRIL